MHLRLRILCLRFLMPACFLFMLAGNLRAATAQNNDEISVKAEVDRAFITIGDPVTYTVTSKHSPDIQILTQIPPPDSDILKIKKIDEIKKKEGSQVVEGRKFTLTTFKLGEFVLDPVTIQYRGGQAGDSKSIQTDKIYLTVKSVAQGEEKKDIRGLKGVLSLVYKIWGRVAFAAALMLAIAVFFIYKNRHKILITPSLPEVILTPEEEALTHLNQLFDSDLIRRGKIKEYYLRLSEILRIYLEKRYQILAVESTTDEIMKALRNQALERSLMELIKEVLEAADLAKFAKWQPEPPQIILLNQKSKQIIEKAKPAESVEPTSHGA